MDLNKLKETTAKSYEEFGDFEKILIIGENSYTGKQIANEVRSGTELGTTILNNLIDLTIDLVARGKEDKKDYLIELVRYKGEDYGKDLAKLRTGPISKDHKEGILKGIKLLNPHDTLIVNEIK